MPSTSVYARRFAAELFGLKTRQFGLIQKRELCGAPKCARWRNGDASLGILGLTRIRGPKPQPIAPVQSAARAARFAESQRQEL